MAINNQDLARLEELRAKAAEGTWVANHYDWDADESVSDDLTGMGPNDRIWTLSSNPAREGWETDSGQPNYGMAQDDALYAAAAMNAVPELVKEIGRLRLKLAFCEAREQDQQLWREKQREMSKRLAGQEKGED